MARQRIFVKELRLPEGRVGLIRTAASGRLENGWYFVLSGAGRGKQMKEKIELSGIVLSSMAVGDYDKRLVLLTKERGKITAFARGARKPNSPYLGISEPFNFGKFTVYEGFDAYRLAGGEIKEYFSDVKKDIEAVCYGTYFCDILEYIGVEGVGDANILNLLYVSLKALMNPKILNPLIRRIFELRLLAFDGEEMHAFSCVKCGSGGVSAFYPAGDGLVCKSCNERLQGTKPLNETTVYTLQYVLSVPLNKLYHFQVSEPVQREFDEVVDQYFRRHVTKKFNSLQILEALS